MVKYMFSCKFCQQPTQWLWMSLSSFTWWTSTVICDRFLRTCSLASSGPMWANRWESFRTCFPDSQMTLALQSNSQALLCHNSPLWSKTHFFSMCFFPYCKYPFYFHYRYWLKHINSSIFLSQKAVVSRWIANNGPNTGTKRRRRNGKRARPETFFADGMTQQIRILKIS